MNLPHSRAPHTTGAPVTPPEALNAALLIDFDNVTMGMRSDLSKELKNLLNSDIIKGKVTVQRAYADWRRYPQYIVPLSENSVDLIFAPAYGSSKKNATDIRMAIDGMELVFIRPEIGTYILLTGDSDFSSLVLKLKEYGKYVIGVGIQESSSDILVQNCDEYYSYTSLTGLRKTTDSLNKAVDPWVLVEQASQKMVSRNDVMRSDRLKQVMMEIDPTFDEGNFGFSKFSRFLSEAASRDLVELKKMENGQYEVRPKSGEKDGSGRDRPSPQRRTSERSRPRDKDRDTKGPAARRGRAGGRAESKGARSPQKGTPDVSPEGTDGSAGGVDPLQTSYGLLRQALTGILDANGGVPVRDSDLKRKMLELDSSFDESELGFGKFSRFLRQAHDHEVVDLEKREEGTYQVSLSATKGSGPEGDGSTETGSKALEDSPAGKGAAGGVPAQKDESGEDLPHEEFGKTARVKVSKGLGPRRGERKGRKGQDGPPALLAGQVVSLGGGTAASPPSGGKVDVGTLGLPSDGSAIISYLTNSYKGVGKKTAESLVEAFGPDLFSVLMSDPEKIKTVVSGRRAEQLLEGWKIDLQRRMERQAQGPESDREGGGKPEQKGPRRSQGGASARGRGSSGDEGPRPPRRGRKDPGDHQAVEKKIDPPATDGGGSSPNPNQGADREAPPVEGGSSTQGDPGLAEKAGAPDTKDEASEPKAGAPDTKAGAPDTEEEAPPRKPVARGRRTRRGGRSQRG